MSAEYEGYKNFETWSVVKSLESEVPYQEAIYEFMLDYQGSEPYKDFMVESGLDGQFTKDVVKYLDPLLDYKLLNEQMRQLSQPR